MQRNSYYPFGKSIDALDFSGAGPAYPYQFNGKEKQTFAGLGWYDYGARFYDPVLARWHSVDPLADKMRRHSPYNYAFDNPMRFIDPDGMAPAETLKVEGTPQFKRDVATARSHLSIKGAGKMLEQLDKSDKTYTIKESKRNQYDSKTRTIGWNQGMGIITETGAQLSPASTLNHEVDHAAQHDKNPEQMAKDRDTKDEKYGNKEEKRVIQGSEQETAKKLGEIKDGEVTRTSHGPSSGTSFRSKSPISNEDINAVTITPLEKGKPR